MKRGGKRGGRGGKCFVSAGPPAVLTGLGFRLRLDAAEKREGLMFAAR